MSSDDETLYAISFYVFATIFTGIWWPFLIFIVPAMSFIFLILPGVPITGYEPFIFGMFEWQKEFWRNAEALSTFYSNGNYFADTVDNIYSCAIWIHLVLHLLGMNLTSHQFEYEEFKGGDESIQWDDV